MDEACLIKCILARAAFGGMTGDIAMLKGFASIWYNRFTTQNKNPPPILPGKAEKFIETPNKWISFLRELYGKVHVTFSYKTVGPLVPEDVPLGAIDFHCSALLDSILLKPVMKKIVENYVVEKYDKRTDIANKLQTMIWHFRSSINLKATVSDTPEPQHIVKEKEKLKDLWTRLKDELDNYSRSFIRKRVQ